MGIDSEADRREASRHVSGEAANREDERSESSNTRAGAAGAEQSEGPEDASGETASVKRHASSEADRREASSRANGEAVSREGERRDPRDSEGERDERTFPGVPESNTDDVVVVPETGSTAQPRGDASRAESAEEGERTPGSRSSSERRSDDGSCGPETCTCGEQTATAADAGVGSSDADGPEGSSGAGSRPVATDGAGVANVDEDGQLGDLEFTAPAEGVSQDVDNGSPDVRVGIPEGVDLDTPEYSIRSEMNDIETPDEKTWFHELDEAVIQDGRCIQCGTCVAACPSDSIGVGEDDHPELVKMCTGCSLCWDFCPRGGLRYERQWVVTGGEDNVKGAGDPITEFSARVDEEWTDAAQDGGMVTHLLATLLEKGEIDGALIATEDDDEPWKAVSYLATSREDLIANAGTIYNQTLAVGNLDLAQWGHKLPDKDWEDLSLAFVGTPCEIEGLRALQDFDWHHDSHEEGVRAVDYMISLMCTKNFNYYSLIGELLEEQRGVSPDQIGKMDVLHGKLMVYGHDGEMIVEEDVKNFHDAALKGCDECADFTGFCADITVGSVGSSDEYSSVIVRTEQGMDAWELTEPTLDYHDLEDRSAVGKLQGWDKKKAFESLERPFEPDAPRFIDYADHAENYGVKTNPHDGV